MKELTLEKGELVQLRRKISSLIKEENVEESEKLCTKLINILLNSKIKRKDTQLWFLYYSRANSYYIMGEYRKALKDAEKTFYYVGDISKLNKKYTFSLWSISTIYEGLGEFENAVSNYKKLSRYYKELNYPNLRIACLFNLAKLLNNTRRMKTLLNIVKDSDKLNKNSTNFSKNQLIVKMEKEIYETKIKVI